MKKLAIFDLDGTLSDTINAIKYCADTALAPFGFGPFTIEQYKYFVGDGADELIKRCLIAGGDKELNFFERVFGNYKEVFKEHCMYDVKPYEGIPELVMDLKKKGLKLAVLSNKPHRETIEVVESLFGKETFHYLQGYTPEIERKPSAEGVFRILEKLNVEKEDIIYIGDTSTDMQTGKNAGVLTVGVLWGFRDEKELVENKADIILKTPLELLDYIN